MYMEKKFRLKKIICGKDINFFVKKEENWRIIKKFFFIWRYKDDNFKFCTFLKKNVVYYQKKFRPKTFVFLRDINFFLKKQGNLRII